MPDFKITEAERDALITSLGDAANTLAGLPEIEDPPPPDPPPPVADSVVSISVNETQPGDLSIEVIASYDGDLDYLQLFFDGGLVDTDPADQHGDRLLHSIADAEPGEHTFRAVAVAIDGAIGEANLTFTVSGDPDPPPPDPDPDPPLGNLIQSYGFSANQGLEGGWASGGYWQMIPPGGDAPGEDRFRTFEGPHGYSARFELRDGDIPHSGTERCEVSGGDVAQEGDTIVVSFYARRDAQYDTLNNGRWQVGPHQMHGTYGGPPPLAWEIDSGDLGIVIHNGGSFVGWAYYEPVDTEWHHYVYRVYLHPSNGTLEVWRDGEKKQMTNGSDVWTGHTVLAGEGYYPKAGIYRNPDFSGTNVYEVGPLTVHEAA